MHSSSSDTALAAGRPAQEDSHIMVAAVAESSTVGVVETEDQSDTGCRKVLASRSDRHGTIEDMDTCRAVVRTTGPKDCDGRTQQVVDWNKKCRGAKSGHLGHLFESHKVSERRIKELASIEKLEVAETTLQEARAQASEIVYARWLDDVARRTLEDPAAVRSSEDATHVNAPDHEDEVQARTPITALRIILSMAATKVIVKERHCTASVVWRNVTTWNGEHETGMCGEGDTKNILMGESVVDVPTTFVSENHGYVPVHRGIGFSLEWQCCRAERGRMCLDGTFQHRDHATNQTDEVRWRDDGKTQLVQRDETEPAGTRMEVKQQVDDTMRPWRLKLETKETPTPVTKATVRRRDIDENLVQHDVQASREAAGTTSPAMGSSMQKETWLYRRQADPKTLHALQNTSRAAEDLTKETVLSIVGEHGRRACCDARPSRITLTHRESESHSTVRRLPEMASLWHVRVAPPGSDKWRERVAPPELMGGSSRTVLTSKQTSQILEQVGTGAEARATSGNSATCEACAGKQSGSVAKPDDRRIDPGCTSQERNPAEVRGHDLEQDTETEAYATELLAMWLRQVQRRRGEGQEQALSCLTLTKSERKTPCEERSGWRRLRGMQW